MRRAVPVALALVLPLAGCGGDEAVSEDLVLNGSWTAPCNPRQELKFVDGRHDANDSTPVDAVMRQDPVHADLDEDGTQELVLVMTCVPRGTDAQSGWSSVEAWVAQGEDESPRQLAEPLLMSNTSCSEVIEELEGEGESVRVTVRVRSDDGCGGEPGDDQEIELAMRAGEPVRLDPLSANFLQCPGSRELAAAGNLVLFTRPNDDSLLAQFPRDAQVRETDVRAEHLYVVSADDESVRAKPGWRLVEVNDRGETLGCAWMPPA